MQPGPKAGRTLERARNVVDLGPLGDPERWGGTGSVEIAAPAVASDRTVFSPQIIRAQCDDLIARAWEMIVFWTLEGADESDTGQLDLEVTLGSGQVTGVGHIICFPPNPIAAAISYWENLPTQGTIHLPERLPACAIAARAKLRIVTDGSVPAHLVRATCRVLVAPRSLT
jgi:hypothetical protein